MAFRFTTHRRRRAALADAVGAQVPEDRKFEVEFAGSAAVAAITEHTFWVVPLGANRSAMVAPSIGAITTVEVRPARRRTEVTLGTGVGEIVLNARRHAAEQLVALLTTHPNFRGRRS